MQHTNVVLLQSDPQIAHTLAGNAFTIFSSGTRCPVNE